MTHIVSAENLTESITALEIAALEIAATAKAGQVVMARIGNESNAHPRAIADFNPEKGTITIVVRQKDCSTPEQHSSAPSATRDFIAEDAARAMLDVNSTVYVDGPMGQPGEPVAPAKALLVAEGLGIPAVFTRIRDLKAAGCYTMLIAGYASKSELFWLDRLNDMCDEIYVVTDDGSFGIKGPVRQTVKAVCDQVQEIEHVFVAGPFDLLKTTANVTRPFEISTTVSLAAVFDASPGKRDGDGEDAAPALDWAGPIELDGHQTDFDELAKTLGLQKKQ
jgi:ferredoxin--NADP+ reductase